MSLIAYTNGRLLADRIAARELGDTPYHETMQKLHIHPNHLYAFAYCGDKLLDRQIKDIIDAMSMALAMWYIGGKKNRLQFLEEYKHLFGNRSYIIMTKDHVFQRVDDSLGFVEIEMGAWVASGTYAASWRVAHSFGLSAENAAKRAVKFSSGLDSPIDVVYTRQLKKFPKLKPDKPAEM
jgi:hypothetical protein